MKGGERKGKKKSCIANRSRLPVGNNASRHPGAFSFTYRAAGRVIQAYLIKIKENGSAVSIVLGNSLTFPFPISLMWPRHTFRAPPSLPPFFFSPPPLEKSLIPSLPARASPPTSCAT